MWKNLQHSVQWVHQSFTDSHTFLFKVQLFVIRFAFRHNKLKITGSDIELTGTVCLTWQIWQVNIFFADLEELIYSGTDHSLRW